MSEEKKSLILKFAEKAGRYLDYGGSTILYGSTVMNFVNFLNSADLFEKPESFSVPTGFAYAFFENIFELKRFKDDIHVRSGYGSEYSIKFDIEYENVCDPSDIPDLDSFVESLDKSEIEIYASIFWKRVKEKNNLDGDEPDDFSTGSFFVYDTEKVPINESYAKEVKLDIYREYIELNFEANKEQILSGLYKDIEYQLGVNGKDIVSALKKSDDDKLKKELAISYYSSDDESVLSAVVQTLGDLFKTIEGKNSKIEPELMITFPKEVIKLWGITNGRFYENAPWNLYRLGPQHLYLEGKIMKHCVGTYSEYAESIIKNQAEIWSLRSREGNPQFTFEIDGVWKDMSGEEREKSIKQIKGKGNRLPGLASKHTEQITLEDEVVFLFCMFRDMGVDLSLTNDINSQIDSLGLSY